MNQRILCVTSTFPRWPGDSTTPFVLNLARDLGDIGWQVDVLAPHAPGIALREQIDGIDVHRFRYMLPEGQQTVCYQGGALINLRKSPLNYLKLPALVAAESVAVAARLLAGDYALVHSHWILPQGFAALPATAVAGIPHIVTVHGGDIFGLRNKLFEPFKKLVLTRADAVTVNSSFTENAVTTLTAGRCVPERIPMGADVDPPDADKAQDVRAAWQSSGSPNLIFVGRLVVEKGVDDLIKAVDILRHQYPELRCRIIGEGQQRAEFEQMVATAGLEAHVEFLGWVQPDEVTAYIAAADCFVGPSKTAPNGWIEAQGLTFIEAMAARTPVVAARSGGIVDSVIDGETGYLVPENDPQAIAAAVQRVVEQPEQARDLVDRAEEHARKRFSRPVSAAAFSELFKRKLATT